MKRTLYIYRYTTDSEVIKEFGSNFFIIKDRILEEDKNEYILKCYDYIRKGMVDDPFYIMNESTNNAIHYTWFSLNNNKDRMNTFKRLVKDRLTKYEHKISEELNYVRNLISNIKEE